MVCMEDREAGLRGGAASGMNYYTSLQMHWLDNIPKPDGLPGVARPDPRADASSSSRRRPRSAWWSSAIPTTAPRPSGAGSTSVPISCASRRRPASCRQEQIVIEHGAVRQGGAAAVRQGPRAPHHAVPPRLRSHALTLTALMGGQSWGTCPRRSTSPTCGRRWSPRVAERPAVVCGDSRLHLRRGRRAGEPAGPVDALPGCEDRRPRRALPRQHARVPRSPSWRASSSGPSPSTSTTATSRTSWPRCSTTPGSSASSTTASSPIVWPPSATTCRTSPGGSTSMATTYERRVWHRRSPTSRSGHGRATTTT